MFTIPRQTAEETLMKEVLPDARTKRTTRSKTQIKNPGKLFARLMGFIFKKYLPACIIVVICIFVSVLANVQGTMFTKNLIDDYIVPLLKTGSPDYGPLLAAMGRVAVFYGIGVISTFAYSKIMIYVSQGTIKNLRVELFSHMQDLPIRYFDSHAHGDIMSIYTNDIDTLRQLISQSLPQILNSAITVVSVFVSMVILNIPLTILTIVMVIVTTVVTKNLQASPAAISSLSSATSARLTASSRKCSTARR